MDAEWFMSFDNEAGPGWEWMVIIPGKDNLMGLDEETARRIVDDHNSALVTTRS